MSLPREQNLNSTAAFEPSARLKNAIDRLRSWQIDRAALYLTEDADENHGGTASVSLARLLTHYRHEGDTGEGTVTYNDQGEHEANTQTLVAVKKMKIAGKLDKESVLRLSARELDVLDKVSHRNIVKLAGFVEELSNGLFWLILSWAPNGDLRQFLSEGNWEITERISLVYDVSQGLKYLHSQTPPICHGDLKSLNILIDSEYRALITDFGSTRVLPRQPAPELPSDGENTRPNVVATASPKDSPRVLSEVLSEQLKVTLDGCTTRWAAPEILSEMAYGLESDIWAFGWICFEILTNKFPFQEVPNEERVVLAIMRGETPDIRNEPHLSSLRALSDLMSDCWMMDPSRRLTAAVCLKEIEWMPRTIPHHIRDPLAVASWPGLWLVHGYLFGIRANYHAAARSYSEALSTYTTLGSKTGRANALLGLAEVHRLQLDFDAAISPYSEALGIYATVGDEVGRAHALLGLAEIQRLQSEFGMATSSYSEALDILKDEDSRADAFLGLAEVYQAQAKFDGAFPLYSDAMTIFTTLNDNRQWKKVSIKFLTNTLLSVQARCGCSILVKGFEYLRLARTQRRQQLRFAWSCGGLVPSLRAQNTPFIVFCRFFKHFAVSVSFSPSTSSHFRLVFPSFRVLSTFYRSIIMLTNQPDFGLDLFIVLVIASVSWLLAWYSTGLLLLVTTILNTFLFFTI